MAIDEDLMSQVNDYAGGYGHRKKAVRRKHSGKDSHEEDAGNTATKVSEHDEADKLSNKDESKVKTKFQLADLVNYLKHSELLQGDLKRLAKERNLKLATLINNGMFYCEDGQEFYDFLTGELQLTQDAIGVGEHNDYVLCSGYYLPLFDYWGNFFGWEVYPDKENNLGHKYLFINRFAYEEPNVSSVRERSKAKTAKVLSISYLGLDLLGQGLAEDRMFVVEGVFDYLHLREAGLPVVALGGIANNKLKHNLYIKSYLRRFSKLYYVADNDSSGMSSLKYFKRLYPNSVGVVPPLYHLSETERVKDVDDLYRYDLAVADDFMSRLKLMK